MKYLNEVFIAKVYRTFLKAPLKYFYDTQKKLKNGKNIHIIIWLRAIVRIINQICQHAGFYVINHTQEITKLHEWTDTKVKYMELSDLS